MKLNLIHTGHSRTKDFSQMWNKMKTPTYGCLASNRNIRNIISKRFFNGTVILIASTLFYFLRQKAKIQSDSQRLNFSLFDFDCIWLLFLLIGKIAYSIHHLNPWLNDFTDIFSEMIYELCRLSKIIWTPSANATVTDYLTKINNAWGEY